jgi:hypothetical protein
MRASSGLHAHDVVAVCRRPDRQGPMKSRYFMKKP